MLSKNEKEKILIGRHISFTKPDYLLGSIREAVDFYKINCFMIYLFSPQVFAREYSKDLKLHEFRSYANEKSFKTKNVVVHSSYLVNLGDFGNKSKLQWSINFLKSEFSKVRDLGLKTIVMHPGSSLGLNRDDSLASVSASLDKVLEFVPDIRVCLETMAGSGTQLGKSFEEIAIMINKSKFKDRVGVCLDTCHLYCSGYDLKSNLDSVLKELDRKIGIQKVWVVHVNDSVFGLNSKRDRHANIGLGQIGLETLSLICYHHLLNKSIKILETPIKNNNFHEKEIDQIKEFFIQNYSPG